MSKPRPRDASAGVREALARLADPERARGLARFFKTGPGEYAEGDVFLGIRVPDLRGVARSFRELEPEAIASLLKTGAHEERTTALIILAGQYERGDARARAERVRLYLDHLPWVNNWDLVDCSAHQILGQHLLTRDRAPLRRFARSGVMWERRVAIVATFAFTLAGSGDATFEIARLLLSDEHDLIHKATGWMLREVGKRVDEGTLRGFLEQHVRELPRTALRYAIERFPERERKAWLAR